MALKNILVTGATGKQGGAVIRALLSSPTPSFHIYALTRNASSPSAQALASKPNITVVEGDTSNPAPIFTSISQPVHGVFSVTVPNPFKAGSFEENQAIPLIDASVKHGVKQFIFTSADRGGPGKADNDPTPVPHFITKFNVENHLKSRNMQWTILRPVAFYENLTPDFIGKGFAAMWRQLGDVKLGLVGTKDIGLVAAKAFLHPENYANRAVTLVGDQLTFAEADKAFEDVVGTKMPITFNLVASGLKWMIHDLGAMFKWFGEGGYAWDMSGVRKEEQLMDFKTWLKSESKFQKS
ncbi:putative NmrA-like family domain-containing protein 1 [Mollisia scopiformis]|uniref:Putative NmrA-like family domain-containing protein 1 n=1 Tax=Mollisia scopiformis TaxID=149040 RepID=A0A194XVH5_MOLSC|nr:putative NmrA-like family domain-containing protein 1 [Mollisia scopiformis]KUJ23712.1 putative NmrA-like family domain-containing protein 1 [Mollisia scopiformis]